jgi:ferritin
MLSKKMEKALNTQMNEELYSFYIYLSMAAYLEANYLKGMAVWMQQQAREEMSHAMKFFSYIHDRNAEVTLHAIEQPPKRWESALAVFENAYAHEQHITERINSLVDLAAKENDHATANFLQWFVKEQVEEEASVDPIVHRLKLAGDNVAAVYVLDRELGMRAAS